MKLVIDIPEDVYAEACVEAKREVHPHQDYRWIRILWSICNGTPLPKGHGRLIDADELIKDRVENDNIVILANTAPTIIEADKVVNE